MRKYTHKDVEYKPNFPFELDGISYPGNWLELASDEDLASRGFVVEEVPLPKRNSVRAEEIIAQFNSSDAAAIKVAVEGNASFWLLWSALQAQSVPMSTSAERFLQGWAALKQVLGADRMNSIRDTLDLEIPK